MTAEDDQMTPAEYAFSEALGHVRNATSALLGEEDQSSDSLLLGIAGLDLQGQFGDIWPVWIDDDRAAAESLAEAERLLGGVIDQVPLGLWAALTSLRRQVSDGDR
ncbi:hypothetical protein [Micropruina sp.]|uniref:hypothetical protein n=1 Tax=Micropruina sp. TaxID=2737536 RepID=UPI002608B3EA|nr:hypothetical protein [Micropruina sp.]